MANRELGHSDETRYRRLCSSGPSITFSEGLLFVKHSLKVTGYEAPVCENFDQPALNVLLHVKNM